MAVLGRAVLFSIFSLISATHKNGKRHDTLDAELRIELGCASYPANTFGDCTNGRFEFSVCATVLSNGTFIDVQCQCEMIMTVPVFIPGECTWTDAVAWDNVSSSTTTASTSETTSQSTVSTSTTSVATPTTSTVTTSTPFTTTSVATTDDSDGILECGALSAPINGAITCNVAKTVCFVHCDNGLVPDTLVDATAVATRFICNHNTGQWSDLSLYPGSCVGVKEVCPIDSTKVDSSATYEVYQVHRPDHDDNLVANILKAKCPQSQVFKFTGSNTEKVRCLCRFIDNYGYVCKKKWASKTGFGPCVDDADESTAAPITTDNNHHTTQGHSHIHFHEHDEDHTHSPDETFSYPNWMTDDFIASLQVRRERFTAFLKSLYDTFWYADESD